MSQSFTYDDLNRLTQAVGSAYGTQNFAYDSIGNMTTKGNLTMSYGTGGSPARPHAVTGVTYSGANYPTFCHDLASGSCAMTYDGNGNMSQRGGDLLTYDSENRLTQMKTYDGQDGSNTYTLKPGWNVISFTYLPADRSVSNVMSSLTFNTDYNQISTWDNVSSSWKNWVNDSDFNDFTQFEYGKTYEIYNQTGSNKSLTVTGKTAALDISHSIKSGDNFISPAVKSSTNISSVLSTLVLNTDYSDVKRFNATTQTWESYVGGAFTKFDVGKGYNIIGLRNASFSYGKTETITTFVYDSTGARVKKTAAGTTTVYLGKDYDVTGSLSTKYIFLGDRRVASRDSSDVKLYFHEDHINSSNVITDSSGNQAALYEYDPYGSTVTHTGATDVKHRFTGQEADDSTHLYNYNARLYDPQLGRFITADPTVQRPADPQDLNRYAYARNNPIRFTDPTGLGWLSKLFAAIAAAITLPFTAGQSAWIIIGIAALAGAVGGLAGAAIEKSNLLKGALEGAAIGAAVGTGASLAEGAPGGGGNLVGYKVTDVEMVTGYTESGKAIVESYTFTQAIVSETTSPLIPNIIGATTAAGGNAASKALPERKPKQTDIQLDVYSRPAGFGLRHTFLFDRTNNRIWEMSSTCTDGNFATCGLSGAPLGFIHSNTFEGDAVTQYLQRWSGTYQKEYTVNVQQNSFYKAVQMYEQRSAGLPYNPAWQNSNYAAKSVVQNSGGQSQTIKHAPDSAFDFKAA